MKRDVYVLCGCWACTLTASTLITASAPLAARHIGASRALAPFTIGAFLFGAAVISVVSSRLFVAVGRGWGFAVGCFLGMAGGLCGVVALETRAPFLVFVACVLIGTSQGLGQFYRFAATEICDADGDKASAVGLVLAGGIVAAIAGPEAAASARRLEPLGLHADFSGCFALVAFANVLNLCLIGSVRFAKVRAYEVFEGSDDPEGGVEAPRAGGLATDARGKTRLRAIFSQPECVCAVWVATLAHTAMVMLMSPLTLAMEQDKFSFRKTSTTLELHFLFMYAPGLFGTGRLIAAFGPYVASGCGLVIFAASASVLAAGQSLAEYASGMVLCGVAWNLCFTSGTVLLTQCYDARDAVRVQGCNDLIIFGVAALGSLGSGYVFSWMGWRRLVFVVSGLMAVAALFLAVSLALQRRAARAGARDDPGAATYAPLAAGDDEPPPAK